MPRSPKSEKRPAEQDAAGEVPTPRRHSGYKGAMR